MKAFILPVIVVLALAAVYLFGAPKSVGNSASKANPAHAETQPPPLLKTSEKSDQELLAIVKDLETRAIQITPKSQPMAKEIEIICVDIPNGASSRTQSESVRDHRNALAAGHSIHFYVYITQQPEQRVVGKSTQPEFPVGSVVVKKKIINNLEHQVLLYTGMLKREKNYNPTCGDWEFFTVSGSGKEVTSRGKLTKCIDCHRDYPKTDYVTELDYSALKNRK